MKPLRVRIRGFKGIRDGLGLDELELDLSRCGSGLVALAGPNGIGKTTILDSLTPWRVLPSRVTGDTYSGFSFYEHLCLPDALRELVWEFAGERYRTQLVFRMNGKRKSEAYLHRWSGRAWVPVCAADGVCSDGKTETYDACLSSLLGSVETFFTSNFSAQGKRNFADYRAGEIKELLSDLLRLDDVRAYSQGAGEVAKLLNAVLASERAQEASFEAEESALRKSSETLGDVDERLAKCERDRGAAQERLAISQVELARVETAFEAAAAIGGRRQALERDVLEAQRRAQSRLAECDAQAKEARDRAAGLRTKLEEGKTAARRRVEELTAEQAELELILCAGAAIRRASKRVVLARAVVRERTQRAGQVAALRDEARDARARCERLADAIAAAEREAGQASLRAADLRRRFKLTAEVPCSGTDLQGQCKLLGDANAARPLIPSADGEIARLSARKQELQKELDGHRAALELSQSALKSQFGEERKFKQSQVRLAYLESLVAATGEFERAQRRSAALAADLANARRAVAVAEGSGEQAAEIARCEVSVRDALARSTQVTAERDADVVRMRAELAALPACADRTAVAKAEAAVRQAAEAVVHADRRHVDAVRAQESARQISGSLAAVRCRRRQGQARREAVQREVAYWSMLQKACSNDGIIALAIDDAGPTLAELTNQLLRTCHGPRFTVAIRTEVETAKGEKREGFDIVVHDSGSDSVKSVSIMSGGQKTIVDLCLTRAIALYLAQNSGRRYSALFSDEADGSLDAENKRMLLAMKREVLRLGGYEVEYFISQTPELVAMADYVIDVAAMRARAPWRFDGQER